MSELQPQTDDKYDGTKREISWLTSMVLGAIALAFAVGTKWIQGEILAAAEIAFVGARVFSIVWLIHTAGHLLIHNSLFRDPAEKAWRAVVDR